jgi:signal transduction histidine kinase
VEVLSACELMEDAIEFCSVELERNGIQLVKKFEKKVPKVQVDRHKTLQILVNFIRNARESMVERDTEKRVLTLRISSLSDGTLRMEVADTGKGIAEKELMKIFQMGFTTKDGGHGFGLHSSALAAREMNGRVSVESEGIGRGATFVLELPCPEITKTQNKIFEAVAI